MKDVRARVYNHRGMCADIWDSSSEANEGVGLQVEGAFDVGHVRPRVLLYGSRTLTTDTAGHHFRFR